MAKKDMLTRLASAFPTNKLTKENAECYLRELADIPDEALDKACDYSLKRNNFFPSVADLRRAAYVAEFGGWEAGWNEVIQNISSRKKPAFRNPILKGIIGSEWEAYSEASHYELGELKKFFHKAYDDTACLYDWKSQPKELTGSPMEQISQAVERAEKAGNLTEEQAYIMKAKIRLFCRGERWMIPNTDSQEYNRRMKELKEDFALGMPLPSYPAYVTRNAV